MTPTSTETPTNLSHLAIHVLINRIRATLTAIEHSRLFVPTCLALAVIIRVGWLYLVNPVPVSDFRWYYDRGQDIAAGHGYSMQADDFWPDNVPPAALAVDNQRRLTAYWPVGYPAFLGGVFFVFGPSLVIAQLANVVLYIGALILAYQIARRAFHSELSGRLTLLILAFYPDHIFYTTLLATEILFLFLLFLNVFLLINATSRLRWLIAAGIVGGLACLVKPQALLVPAVIITAQFVADRRWSTLLKSGLIVYLLLGLTLLPWTWRNLTVFGDFVFISTNGGYNLLVGNNPYANGTYGRDKRLAAMLSDVAGELARNVKARDLAINYIREQPLQTVKLWPKKIWYLYKRESIGLYWNQQGLSQQTNQDLAVIFKILMGIARLYYGLIGFLFLAALFALRRAYSKIRLVPFLGIGLILYFTGIAILTFGSGRFHFPIIPWMIIYIGAGITAWFGLLSTNSDPEIRQVAKGE